MSRVNGHEILNDSFVKATKFVREYEGWNAGE